MPRASRRASLGPAVAPALLRSRQGDETAAKAADDGDSGRIAVLCRLRPLLPREGEAGDWLQVDPEGGSVAASTATGEGEERFAFDRVLPADSSQAAVWESVEPIVAGVLDGYNGAVMAYGQTGSGKTHTMMQPGEGVVPRALAAVARAVRAAHSSLRHTIRVSMLEIYMEKLGDLLRPDGDEAATRPRIFDSAQGAQIRGAVELVLSGEDPRLDAELQAVFARGEARRTAEATEMNARSSRSHCVFVLRVEAEDAITRRVRAGRLVLADLAGSERAGSARKRGETRAINRSLLALRQVIKALTSPAITHTPYRESLLTRLLQDSIGGNSKTALVVCCSPAAAMREETLSTLRFGRTARRVATHARVNQTLSEAALRRIVKATVEENRELKRLLAACTCGAASAVPQEGRVAQAELDELLGSPSGGPPPPPALADTGRWSSVSMLDLPRSPHVDVSGWSVVEEQKDEGVEEHKDDDDGPPPDRRLELCERQVPLWDDYFGARPRVGAPAAMAAARATCESLAETARLVRMVRMGRAGSPAVAGAPVDRELAGLEAGLWEARRTVQRRGPSPAPLAGGSPSRRARSASNASLSDVVRRDRDRRLEERRAREAAARAQQQRPRSLSMGRQPHSAAAALVKVADVVSGMPQDHAGDMSALELKARLLSSCV